MSDDLKYCEYQNCMRDVAMSITRGSGKLKEEIGFCSEEHLDKFLKEEKEMAKA